MQGVFLIHTYNTLEQHLLDKAEELHYDVCIFDASDTEAGRNAIDEMAPGKVRHVENTGHNITSYFTYFADHLEAGDLPDLVCLLKGNILGRHCSREYFDQVIGNTFFTFLYEERPMRDRYSKATKETLSRNGGKDPSEGCIANILTQSWYIEQNSSWYMRVDTHTSRYFDDYDDVLRFVYKDPVIPKYVLFSPGACYIVPRDQIALHGPAFYRNLNKLQDYTLTPGFPAEAYIIERMLPVIFTDRSAVNPWMEDERVFDEKLQEAKESLARKRQERAEAIANRTFLDKVKGRLKRL